MPIPSRRKDEKPNDFMSRCMGDNKLSEEFPNNKQRTAVCMSKACETLDYMEAADFNYSYDTYGFEEEINEDNFVIPAEADYTDVEEEVLYWDIAVDKPGLWKNIRRKKEREGKNIDPLSPEILIDPLQNKSRKLSLTSPLRGHTYMNTLRLAKFLPIAGRVSIKKMGKF